MSAKVLPGCALGLTDEALSAWRDEALSAQEMRRITEHVRYCTTCRTQLAQYDRLATLLRSERVPLPQQPLWPQLRSRLDELNAPSTSFTSGRVERAKHFAHAAATVQRHYAPTHGGGL